MAPTRFDELNRLLADFVSEVRRALDGNLCGIYLQGSFALGGGDEHSDVDFVVVTEREVASPACTALQEMHGRLFARPEPWAQHLEGSYIPRQAIRRIDPTKQHFPFLDNGASRLEPSDHCNTAVVRWILRKHGIALWGPEPKTFIDPVSAADLRAEAVPTLREYVDWAPEPTNAGGMSQWKQVYLVITYCRILCLLATGTVCSKKRGAQWALSALDAEWRDVIQDALDNRADPWGRVWRPAEPRVTQRTLAFAEYALRAGERIARKAQS